MPISNAVSRSWACRPLPNADAAIENGGMPPSGTFDRFEPPFAITNGPATLMCAFLLISQRRSRQLFGLLNDIMQTLKSCPKKAQRDRKIQHL